MMIIVLELKLSTTVIAVIQFRRCSFMVVPLQSKKSRDTDTIRQTNIISLISGCSALRELSLFENYNRFHPVISFCLSLSLFFICIQNKAATTTS